jgi:hypothetical protein
MNIVRWHDGSRYVSALDGGEGRKYRHLVLITESGVRVEDVPLDDPIEQLGVATRKQLRTFRRAGRVFGISSRAKEVLDEAEAHANAARERGDPAHRA